MNSNMKSNDLLNALSHPFHPSHITWKPGALNKDKTKALALAYADLRAYMQRLDDVCGLDWCVSYTPWGERIICNLTILGVTRSSTGEPDSQSEKSEIAGTAAEAQAFKRACAMFGLGRYLYNLPSIWAEFDNAKRQFTEAAKARVTNIVVEHHRRHVDAEVNGCKDSTIAAVLVTAKDINSNLQRGTPTLVPAVQNPMNHKPSVERLIELEALAKLYYEAAWQTELQRLVTFVSEGRTEEHKQLASAEVGKIIDGLTKKLQVRTPALA